MLFVWYFFIVCSCFYSSYQLTGKSTEDVSSRLHGVRRIICVWGYVHDKQERCGLAVAFFFSYLFVFLVGVVQVFFWQWWVFLVVVWVWGLFWLFFGFNINLLSAYIPKVCKDGCLCLCYSGMAQLFALIFLSSSYVFDCQTQRLRAFLHLLSANYLYTFKEERIILYLLFSGKDKVCFHFQLNPLALVVP